MRPGVDRTRSSHASASFSYQDLSDEVISVEERNFICEELRGHHNLLDFATNFSKSVENRYRINRNTVNNWLKNFDLGKPQFTSRGSPFAIGEQERVHLSEVLVAGRNSRKLVSSYQFVELVNDAAARERLKRCLPAKDTQLCTRTVKKIKKDEQVRIYHYLKVYFSCDYICLFGSFIRGNRKSLLLLGKGQCFVHEQLTSGHAC